MTHSQEPAACFMFVCDVMTYSRIFSFLHTPHRQQRTLVHSLSDLIWMADKCVVKVKMCSQCQPARRLTILCTLRSETVPGVARAAAQYDLSSRFVGCLTFDITKNPWRCGNLFDAIITGKFAHSVRTTLSSTYDVLRTYTDPPCTRSSLK